MFFSSRQQWLALAVGAGILLGYGAARLIKAFGGRAAAPVRLEVKVPVTVSEAEPAPPPVAGGPAYGVDINHASAAELEAVPGIGPQTARHILALRAKLGGFQSLDQLTGVPGIKQRRLGELAPYLRLAPSG